ncbi:hypothetical protein [Pelagibacterium limicola]|uniref:hypothetical protein n=1 Tax=Pelagibacterium limicola TaxID=2791022 RepID=UPI0018AF5E3E|nr:hypothetical protein [Pelagibacterium limicola]
MSDMATAAVATKQALFLHKAQIAMVKKQHEMEMSLINMLTEAVENAPRPDGTGAVVNKSA